MPIRPFLPGDSDGVAQLWRTVFPDDPPWNSPEQVIALKQTVQADLFLVFESEEVIRGTVIAGFDGVRGWIHKLATDPACQGQGIGQALMHAAEAGLKSLGCPKVNLQVRAGNEAVVGFYESIGYVSEERISMGKQLGKPSAT